MYMAKILEKDPGMPLIDCTLPLMYIKHVTILVPEVVAQSVCCLPRTATYWEQETLSMRYGSVLRSRGCTAVNYYLEWVILVWWQKPLSIFFLLASSLLKSDRRLFLLKHACLLMTLLTHHTCKSVVRTT